MHLPPRRYSAFEIEEVRKKRGIKKKKGGGRQMFFVCSDNCAKRLQQLPPVTIPPGSCLCVCWPAADKNKGKFAFKSGFWLLRCLQSLKNCDVVQQTERVGCFLLHACLLLHSFCTVRQIIPNWRPKLWTVGLELELKLQLRATAVFLQPWTFHFVVSSFISLYCSKRETESWVLNLVPNLS